MRTIPIEQPQQLFDDILPVTTVGPLEQFPELLIKSFEGTGFVIGDGFFVTCWHCVAADPPKACPTA